MRGVDRYMLRNPNRPGVAMPPAKTVGEKMYDSVPIFGRGLQQDAETSGLALVVSEIQARFLGSVDRENWVSGDTISEAPAIELTEV